MTILEFLLDKYPKSEKYGLVSEIKIEVKEFLFI